MSDQFQTTYHTVTWNEEPERGGIMVQIQLVHPDGRNRGICLMVPDLYLFPVHPGLQFPEKRLVPSDLHPEMDGHDE